MRLRSKKLGLANDVIRIIRDLCKLVFNISSTVQMENIFGLSEEQLERIIKKIIDGVPERIFEPSFRRKLEEFKTICAREFIFFQVQEKNSPNYKEALANFIKIFFRDIEKRL